jgi:alkanesulfonate monooxygenase SsuD/methylene tetrahydromethanopterin reductase-like flavin-dependent oxidoreductase (luciferase family)
MTFRGEWAVKFALQTNATNTAADWLRLARHAQDQGFSQVWVNDNLGQRHILVLLAAIASQVPLKVGTSIVTPYFRNPVDLADSIATLAELTEGREVSIGIARGDLAHAGRQVEMSQPISMVRDTAGALKALLAGQTIRFRDYPALASYHHIRPEHEFRLAFAAPENIRFYCGGNGPQILHIAGAMMDGALIGNHFCPLARSGRLPSLLAITVAAAAASQSGKALWHIGELDISISRDRRRAMEFARPHAARILIDCVAAGYSEEEFHRLGIAPDWVERLQEAYRQRLPMDQVASSLPDTAVRGCFVVGTPEDCHDQLAPLLEAAARNRLGQISFTKLGPDCREAVRLIGQCVMPH